MQLIIDAVLYLGFVSAYTTMVLLQINVDDVPEMLDDITRSFWQTRR